MIRRRAIFSQVAQDYDAVRPGYPTALIEAIIAISALPKQGQILEIGCGTGQATRPFARRGYRIKGLDIGPELVALAGHNCRDYPNVQFEVTSFEDWRPDTLFDLVISATAFHWIPPEIGYPKIARILKERGYLATFANMHPTPYSGFFAEVQAVYRHVVPEWADPAEAPSTEEKIQAQVAAINETGLFGPVQVKQYSWSKVYPAEAYLKLLNTYSDHRSLGAEKRTALFGGIERMIAEKYGGQVTRPYLSVLYIASKALG